MRGEFQERLARYLAAAVACRGLCQEPVATLSGELVAVEANLGTGEDVQAALDNGADGVGLCRVEQLYLARESPPDVDELLQLHGIAMPFRGKTFTVRLLDVGGDKNVPYLWLGSEGNPLLGRRRPRAAGVSAVDCARTVASLRLFQEQAVCVLVPM